MRTIDCLDNNKFDKADYFDRIIGGYEGNDFVISDTGHLCLPNPAKTLKDLFDEGVFEVAGNPDFTTFIKMADKKAEVFNGKPMIEIYKLVNLIHDSCAVSGENCNMFFLNMMKFLNQDLEEINNAIDNYSKQNNEHTVGTIDYLGNDEFNAADYFIRIIVGYDGRDYIISDTGHLCINNPNETLKKLLNIGVFNVSGSPDITTFIEAADKKAKIFKGKPMMEIYKLAELIYDSCAVSGEDYNIFLSNMMELLNKDVRRINNAIDNYIKQNIS